jgi:hypothetical protein
MNNGLQIITTYHRNNLHQFPIHFARHHYKQKQIYKNKQPPKSIKLTRKCQHTQLCRYKTRYQRRNNWQQLFETQPPNNHEITTKTNSSASSSRQKTQHTNACSDVNCDTSSSRTTSIVDGSLSGSKLRFENSGSHLYAVPDVLLMLQNVIAPSTCIAQQPPAI